MATDILANTSLVYEGNGAYRINGNTIYKGENVDNYVSFSNMLWRIIKIKSDLVLTKKALRIKGWMKPKS